MRKVAFAGFLLMIVGYVFGIAETLYFGSNWLPKTTNEMVCDSISLQICTIGETLFIGALIVRLRYNIREIKKIFK